MFVLERFQLRLILHITVAAWAFFTLVAFVIFGPSVTSMLTGWGAPTDEAEIAERVLALHGSVWPALTLSAIFLVIVGIRVSHRIAGPLFRILSVIRSLERGTIPNAIRFRPKDLLREEADAVNAMLASLRARVSELHALQEEIDGLVDRVAIEASGSSEDVVQAVSRLQEKEELFSRRLGEFALEHD